MPYSLPTFNLLCNIWHPPYVIPPIGGPSESIVPCQLRDPGRGPSETQRNPTTLNWQPGFTLLVPKLTDVRDAYSPGGADLIECPAGSNRWYQANYVDDVAKGFPNEYRKVFLCKAGTWPSPIP